MTPIPFFQIDAFAERALQGNPAAVMPMPAFPTDEVMQAIAAENNVSETAFIVPNGIDCWRIRWFTPTTEVPLCGHATLASAHALFEMDKVRDGVITFQTRQSGELYVKRLADSRLEMDFPISPAQQVHLPHPKDASEEGVGASSFLLADFTSALNATPIELWSSNFMLAIFDNPDTVRNLNPNMDALSKLSLGKEGDTGSLICAAIGDDYDVVSRVFVPEAGIPEDPATGSAHCVLAPVFSQKLQKSQLSCFQAFPGRGAKIETIIEGNRVKLIGRGQTVIKGEFFL